MNRYHVRIDNDQGGAVSSSLAHNVGNVVSTVQNYDGVCDLALIDVPDDASEYFESMLEADEDVVSYRC